MSRHRLPHKKIELNLTPMLDLVFQLVVFFLLVTNFSAAQLPDLNPPDPDHSQAYTVGERERVIINVLPDGGTGQIRSIRVGINRIDPGDYERLTELLQAEQSRYDDVQVDLRADASLEVGAVRPIMNAVTAAGIGRINLVSLLDRDSPAAAPPNDHAAP